MKKLLMATVLLAAHVQVGTAAPMLSQEMVGHINSLDGSAADEMYKSAWQCFLDARLVMLGAGLKSKGGNYEEMLASQGFSDRTRGIVEDGFKYSDPLDKGISDIFATCLHSAHEGLLQ